MLQLVLDPESDRWVRELTGTSALRRPRVVALHALLLRVARSEALRRRARLPGRGFDEVDDLCVQAASDAVMTILRKVDTFQGCSRFTTWACKFVLFELCTRLRRHASEQRRMETDEGVWALLPDATPPAVDTIHQKQLQRALARAMGEQLTDRQRSVFRAAILEDVPIDTLAARLGSSRAAIYKTLHDARSRLRRTLTDDGLLAQ